MEFSEKLQQLRKQEEWTQEELAEKLFVSRAAVSKWETGNGYPNLDSLKDIAKLFKVSIDELLSNAELINIADEENKLSNKRLLSVVFGILDIATLSFLFIPLFGVQIGDYIGMESLANYSGPNYFLFAFSITFIVLAIVGIAELVGAYKKSEKLCDVAMRCSVVLHTLAVLAFIMTREPYATALILVFLIAKVSITLYQRSRLSR